MSNKKRISVHLGPPMRALLDNRPTRPDMNRIMHPSYSNHSAPLPEEISISVSVNRIAERYHWALMQHWPLISEGAWVAMLNAFNGTTEMPLNEIRFLAGFVADDLGVESREEFTPELEELSALEPVQQLALFEVCERVWGAEARQDKSLRDWLAEISGRPAFSVYAEDPGTDDPQLWRIHSREEASQGELITLAHQEIDGLSVGVLLQDSKLRLDTETWRDAMRRPFYAPTEDPASVIFSATKKRLTLEEQAQA